MLILIGIAVLASFASCGSKSGHKLEEKREQARVDSLEEAKEWYYAIRLKNGSIIEAVDHAKMESRRIGDSVCVDIDPYINVIDNDGEWRDMDSPACVGTDSTDVVCWQYKIGIIMSRKLK